MKKQVFEDLLKRGYITNTAANKYLQDEKAMAELTLEDLYANGIITVTGLVIEEEVIVEETTPAPAPTTEEPKTKAPKKTQEETTPAPAPTTEEPKGAEIIVDEGDDE